MKKFIFLLTTVFITALCVNGQTLNKAPHEYKNDAVKLKLSNDQAAKMDGLKAEWKNETNAINKDKSLSKVEKKVKINELKESYRPRRDAIYTPEQREIMKDYDTGMFGTANMERNKEWNERNLKKEADNKEQERKSGLDDDKATEVKEDRRSGPPHPGDRRLKKESNDPDPRSSVADNEEDQTVKQDRRMRRPGPPRPGEHRVKKVKEYDNADQPGMEDEKENTESVKEEKIKRRPGPPRLRRHKKVEKEESATDSE